MAKFTKTPTKPSETTVQNVVTFPPPPAMDYPRDGVHGGDGFRLGAAATRSGGGLSPNPHPKIVPDHMPAE